MRIHHVQVSCPTGARTSRAASTARGSASPRWPSRRCSRPGAAAGSVRARGTVASRCTSVSSRFRAGPQGAPGLRPRRRGARRDRRTSGGAGLRRGPHRGGHLPGTPSVPHRRRARQPGGAAALSDRILATHGGVVPSEGATSRRHGERTDDHDPAAARAGAGGRDEPEPAPVDGQGVVPARVRPVERRPQLRRAARAETRGRSRTRRCPTSRGPR